MKPIPQCTLLSPGPFSSSGKFFTLPRHKSPVSIRKPDLLVMGTLTHFSVVSILLYHQTLSGVHCFPKVPLLGLRIISLDKHHKSEGK